MSRCRRISLAAPSDRVFDAGQGFDVVVDFQLLSMAVIGCLSDQLELSDRRSSVVESHHRPCSLIVEGYGEM